MHRQKEMKKLKAELVLKKEQIMQQMMGTIHLIFYHHLKINHQLVL